QHEGAVACGQEGLEFRIAATAAHEVEQLAAQVACQGRIGVGQALVLADQAAQLRRQCAETLPFGFVGEVERLDGARGIGKPREDEAGDHAEPASRPRLHVPASRAMRSSSGSSAVRTGSSLTGPTNLWRMMPWASMTKVSGAPYTP